MVPVSGGDFMGSPRMARQRMMNGKYKSKYLTFGWASTNQLGSVRVMDAQYDRIIGHLKNSKKPVRFPIRYVTKPTAPYTDMTFGMGKTDILPSAHSNYPQKCIACG